MLNMLGSISDYNTPMEVHLEKIYQYGQFGVLVNDESFNPQAGSLSKVSC